MAGPEGAPQPENEEAQPEPAQPEAQAQPANPDEPFVREQENAPGEVMPQHHRSRRAETGAEPMTDTERLRRDEELRQQQAAALGELQTRYAVADPANPPDVAPGVIRADLDQAQRLGLIVQQNPDQYGQDPTWGGGRRVPATPELAGLENDMRAAWGRHYDALPEHAARLRTVAMDDITNDQVTDPATIDLSAGRYPTVDELAKRLGTIAQSGAYRLEPGRYDGMFPMPRVEGTTEQTREELEALRENVANMEYVRRYQEITSEVQGLPAEAQVDRMVRLLEHGIRQGELTLTSWEEKVQQQQQQQQQGQQRQRQPKTTTITHYEVVKANNPQNAELATQYAEAFNVARVEFLDDATLTRHFEDKVRKEIAPNLKTWTEEGSQLQSHGLSAERMASEARAVIEREGRLSPIERARLEENRRREQDAAAERRIREADERAHPQAIRPDEERSRMGLEDARDEAMRLNASEFEAMRQAGTNMPAEFLDRMEYLRLRMHATDDESLRATLREQFDQMQQQMWERSGEAAEEQRRRNADIGKNPELFDPVADVHRQDIRRQQFIAWFETGAGFDSLDEATGQFSGGRWDMMSDLEREKATPFVKLARQARLDAERLQAEGLFDEAANRAAHEREFLRQGAEAREKALADYTRATHEIRTTATEVASNAAQAVADHEQGTFHIGRTTNEQLNADIIRAVREQFGMSEEPIGTLAHRADRPTRKNGKPIPGRRGELLATDLIFRAPNFQNVVFVARYNVDGQLVSADIHVTEGQALRQAKGRFRTERRGEVTGNVTPELEDMLTAEFEEVKDSVSNPAAADRKAGKLASVGSQWGNRGTEAPNKDFGEGYVVPEGVPDSGEGEGGLWSRQSIQTGLIEAGLPEPMVGFVTPRRFQRRRPGQARRWWFERAMNREDVDNRLVVTRRNEDPARWRRAA